MGWPVPAQRVLLAAAALLLALSFFAARREAAVPAATPVADDPGLDLRLDLNAASAADLETLPGVGQALAARIVAHRDAHGPFRSVGDLGAVPGLSPKVVGRVAPLLSVATP